MFKTELIAKHSQNNARVTRVTTPHGEFISPTFMPVATRAYVNHMRPDDLSAAGSQIILGGNTYHMLINPGMEVIRAAGGMHPFMDWQGPMLTDSGGFQVFSLAKNSEICKMKKDGAHFKVPDTGQKIILNPKSSIETQKIIGADIIMAFDECTPERGGRDAAEAALERTHRWLLEAIEMQTDNPNSAYGNRQALFGIIQGGSFRDLRDKSAEFITSQPLDGFAIGGEVIGFDMAKTVEVVDWVRPYLPDDKTRYTMGVGLSPQDLIDVVAAGIDIFDCVAPTRNARHGALYHGEIVVKEGWLQFKKNSDDKDRILIKKGIYAKDQGPIMEGCHCHTCQHHTRAYLHFLFKSKSPAYSQLACIHNIHVMHEVCRVMRDLVLADAGMTMSD